MFLKAISLFILLILLVEQNATAEKPSSAASDLPVRGFVAEVDDPLAIVVNKANPIENLSFVELRRFFLAERSTWPNGRRVTLVMQQPGQPERDAVLRMIYRMNESDFKRYFLQAQFSGEVSSTPKTLNAAAGVRKFVFNVPGAIGYVRASETDETVKVIRIDNKMPDDPGYKLRVR